MKLWGLILTAVLFSIPPQFLHAEENTAHDWRVRSSALDRDTYSENDADEELSFGREIAARVLGQYKVSGNKKLQKYVNLVGAILTRNSNRPELNFHFVVIEGNEINSYSTPGGYVFITTSVLEKLDNEAELAGVLAHEITHVTERHIVKELSLKGVEKSAVSSITALIGGASKTAGIAFAQAVDKAVDMILRDGYKKEDEIQADVGAVLLCALSGYDPSGLVTLLDKISKIKNGVGKTYPAYDVRLATIQQALSDESLAGAKLALNTDRFMNSMKLEGNVNPFDLIRKLTPGGTP